MLKSYCFSQGKGTPLVFLHGFLGSAFDWKSVISHFSDRTCIALDLPGHGNSHFVENFVDNFPHFEEKIHLIGYSLGGRLAMQLQQKNPERIAKLTLISAHPGLKTKKEKVARYKRDLMWAEKIKTLPVDLFFKEWYDQPIFSGFRPLHRDLERRDDLAKALLHFSLAKQTRFDPKTAQILLGEKDVAFHALYKTFSLIPHAGHMIPLENPKDLSQYL